MKSVLTLFTFFIFNFVQEGMLRVYEVKNNIYYFLSIYKRKITVNRGMIGR